MINHWPLEVKLFYYREFCSLSNASLIDTGCILEEVIVLITEDHISSVASDLFLVEGIFCFLSDVLRLEHNSSFSGFSSVFLIEVDAVVSLEIETFKELLDFTLCGSERHALQNKSLVLVVLGDVVSDGNGFAFTTATTSA